MCQAHPGGMWIPGILGTMTNLAVNDRPPVKATRLASRGDLTSFFMQLCARLRADSYMLVALVNGQDRSEVRIVASNWIFDAIRLVGNEFIADLVESRPVGGPWRTRYRAAVQQGAGIAGGADRRDGAAARRARPRRDLQPEAACRQAPLLPAVLRRRSPAPSRRTTLQEAQMLSCYALSQVPEMLEAAAMENPLSERERECLYWVSAGKTTDEVAVILGVSSNTVNSYVAHAIQKFGASNRAMAMATAIRSGII